VADKSLCVEDIPSLHCSITRKQHTLYEVCYTVFMENICCYARIQYIAVQTTNCITTTTMKRLNICLAVSLLVILSAGLQFRKLCTNFHEICERCRLQAIRFWVQKVEKKNIKLE